MAKRSLFDFLRDQWTPMPVVVEADLTGKTVVVVGANTGIGYEAAKHFASMKAGKIIMACRSEERGQAALERLVDETGYRNVEVWLLDLAKFSSVSAFGDRFDREEGRLDILVLNAGLMMSEYTTTEDGWESCLQVNNMASPLLSFRLLPHMVKTANKYGTMPRLVTVSSDVHYWASVGNDLLNSSDVLEMLSSKEFCTFKYLGTAQYNTCKLLNVLFTRALQDRLSTVTVNCCSPGFCSSELRRNLMSASTLHSVVEYVMVTFLAFSSEEGSRQIIYSAVGEHNEMRGAFVMKSVVAEPSDFVLSPNGERMQHKYWDSLVHALSKVDEKVAGIIQFHLV